MTCQPPFDPREDRARNAYYNGKMMRSNTSTRVIYIIRTKRARRLGESKPKAEMWRMMYHRVMPDSKTQISDSFRLNFCHPYAPKRNGNISPAAFHSRSQLHKIEIPIVDAQVIHFAYQVIALSESWREVRMSMESSKGLESVQRFDTPTRHDTKIVRSFVISRNEHELTKT